MKPRTLPIAALLAAVLTLAACGSKTAMDAGPDPVDPVSPDDPRVVRLGDLLERSDALLLSSIVTRYALMAEDETLAGTLVESMTCMGARCVAADGQAVTIRDLLDPAALGEAAVALGARGGFDTVTTTEDFEVTETLPGVTVTAAPEALGYGFWGVHGFAAVTVAAGALSGLIDDVPFTGDFALASTYALGDVSGSNPAGMGSAVWTGIAEAVSRTGFERHEGTVTVTIADLSRPRVGVAIDVPGQSIGAPGWADMPLDAGSFSTGTAGTDYLAGNLYGPAHEEAWGVFDTADHLGAFGAGRER